MNAKKSNSPVNKDVEAISLNSITNELSGKNS